MGVPGGFWGAQRGPQGLLGAAMMSREELTYLAVLLGSIPVGFVLKDRGEGAALRGWGRGGVEGFWGGPEGFGGS